MARQHRLSRRNRLGVDGTPDIKSTMASEHRCSFSLLSAPTTASVSYLEASRTLGFTGLFLAGPSLSTAISGCGGRRRGLQIMICGPSLLSVNSLAFMVSGTKEIWASTGALANVLFILTWWHVPKGQGIGLQIEGHRNLRRGAGSQGIPSVPPTSLPP